MEKQQHLTPTEVVFELDKYIIGQDDAKRAVAIAIRNRWRRQQLSADMRNEVAPKNIIMAGPTGVGKTEIARRLAGLVGAPFIKIEATKFTEIGYVGRDVESMVRDLVARSGQLVRDEMAAEHSRVAMDHSEQRILDILLPSPIPNPNATEEERAETIERHNRTLEKLRGKLQNGSMEDKEIEIAVQEKGASVGILSNVGMDQMGPEMEGIFDKLMPSRTKLRRLKIGDARNIIYQQELDKLIDQDKMAELAIERAEQSGIIFLDEIDKLCPGDSISGGDVSREGVQRDLLPLVEGCSVNTRQGMIKTDHILFIAAGAFSKNKPSDMMPELQGRFPIRVKLKDLNEEEFCRILTEPKNSLTSQQVALLKTEGVNIKFTDEGVKAMAKKAFEMNTEQQNIGARRLYAVMEKVLEQVSFDAPDKADKKYVIDADFVEKHLSNVSEDEDLNVFGFASAIKDKK
ncbi:MAG: ATP-dependent protease ATPase subunit HslU [Phycisphaerae bacterium]|nr:ATP-dependent protease ATPase subunit HslU [Phycisphaerae bacterium]